MISAYSYSYSMNTTNRPQPYTETRPWGQFIQFSLNEPTTVKILTVRAGEQFSLQYHNHRIEQWYVIDGTGTITIGDTTRSVQVGHTYIVPEQSQHRIHADTDVSVLEIAFGVFDENDIVRLKDNYGRIADISV